MLPPVGSCYIDEQVIPNRGGLTASIVLLFNAAIKVMKKRKLIFLHSGCFFNKSLVG
jgi:hypothetical protein